MNKKIKKSSQKKISCNASNISKTISNNNIFLQIGFIGFAMNRIMQCKLSFLILHIYILIRNYFENIWSIPARNEISFCATSLCVHHCICIANYASIAHGIWDCVDYQFSTSFFNQENKAILTKYIYELRKIMLHGSDMLTYLVNWLRVRK